MRNNLYKVLVIVVVALILNACYYDQVLPPKVTEPMSFSNDIIPIFNKSCNITGCHNGSIAPDLRSENAFNALNTGGYINTANPENSELYLWMTGSGGRLVMPPSGANANDNAKVLAWIQQGALNN